MTDLIPRTSSSAEHVDASTGADFGTVDDVVAHAVESLGAEWMVADIDCLDDPDTGAARVLIGPAGVFTVCVVGTPGGDIWLDDVTLVVDTDRGPRIAAMRREALEVSRALAAENGIAPRVTPVLVVTEAESIAFGTQPTKVVVLRSERLIRWLSQRPRVLDSAALGRVRRLARDRSIDYDAEFAGIAARTFARSGRVLLALEISALALFVTAVAVIQF